MIRRAAHALAGLGTALTFAASLWVLSQDPFAEPIAFRSIEGARAGLDRALALRVTPEYLAGEIAEAERSADAERMRTALTLADQRGIALPDQLEARAEALLEETDAPLRRLTDCAACAWDITSCVNVSDIAICALPVEVTPLGDVNALRRAAAAHLRGGEIDRIDAGLALVGLAATGAMLVTAGGTLPVKLGATTLRLAHRAGTLTRPLRQLVETAVKSTDWSRVPQALLGPIPLSSVTDTARLTRLTSVAADMGTVARNTSPAGAVSLLRYVEGAEDARHMARLSRIEGSATRRTLHALGKARTFRAITRVADLALAALGLLAALAAQILALALALGRRLLRAR